MEPTVSAATMSCLWNVSMFSMRTKTSDSLYWFEKVGFESATNGFCSNHILILKRLNVVHDDKAYNNRYWLEKSASNLKPTFSGATIHLWWNISMLSMTAKTNDHLYSFEEVCFESETNGFCYNSFLMVIRLNVVHDSQRLRWSVLI